MKAHRSILVFLVPITAVLVLVPPFLDTYVQHMLILVFLYAYLAAAWNILGGYAGQLSLGHALFVGAGAYTSTLLFIWFRLSPWLGMFAGAAVSTLMGLFIGYLSFRYRVKGPFFALATLAFTQIFVFVALNTKQVGGASGLTVPLVDNSLAHYQFTGKIGYYYIILALLALGLGITYWLRRTRTGYYFVAIRENEAAAQALGINLMRYKLIATAISASLSALGGTFYAQYVLFIDPHSTLGLAISLQVIIYSVVGGMGTVFGPVLGALVLVPVAEVVRSILGRGGVSGIHLMVYGAFLVFAILFLRDGIMGWLRGLFTRPTKAVGRARRATGAKPGVQA